MKILRGIANAVLLASLLQIPTLNTVETKYTVYIPLVQKPASPKGLAQAYPGDRLGAGWWYVWSTVPEYLSDPGYVPMSRDGSIPNLPDGYSGWLLVFNEPDQQEPYGHPVAPAEAVVLVNAIREKYPQANLVVGNVTASGYQWLIDYQSAGGTAEAWGIHGYTDISPALFTSYWKKAHNATGGKYWITELGEINGNVLLADNIITWIGEESWIERWAWFTNTASGEEEWYPDGWKVQLVEWGTEKLTPLGEWYLTK